jgi:hypothetical protein
MNFKNFHGYLQLVFLFTNVLEAEEVRPFEPVAYDRLLYSSFSREGNMKSIPQIVKNDLMACIEDGRSRETYFNTALDLIRISNRDYETDRAPVQKLGKFVFHDQQNGSWRIAFEILKVLADYSLKDTTAVEIDEKARYLMAYAAHCYGRIISADLPTRGADDLVLKELEIYYKNQAVAESTDLSIYAWYVYFIACIELRFLEKVDLVKIESIISDPKISDAIHPRAYQMLCMARMKGDGGLDYEGRKAIFKQKIFTSLMRFGPYLTPEGFYSPYVDDRTLMMIMDSTRKGYGINQTTEELRKIYLKHE